VAGWLSGAIIIVESNQDICAALQRQARPGAIGEMCRMARGKRENTRDLSTARATGHELVSRGPARW
jgi:hypothetical protein